MVNVMMWIHVLVCWWLLIKMMGYQWLSKVQKLLFVTDQLMQRVAIYKIKCYPPCDMCGIVYYLHQ